MQYLFVWSVVTPLPGGRPDPVQGAHVHTVHDQHTHRVRDMQDLLHVAHRALAHMPDMQARLAQEVLHEGNPVIIVLYLYIIHFNQD